MQALPHVYSVAAAGAEQGSVKLSAAGVPPLLSAAPAEFDGPGDRWSPEYLLAGAIASCFILSFRAVARAARLSWTHLDCHVDGTLERVEGILQFTRVVVHATLTVPAGSSTLLCERALEKAEKGCLVASSLRGSRELRIEIVKGFNEEPQRKAV
ncbi:MAG TPA: OsmC family protein [Steroidobacteraceae bacterium]|nr:OsmC family protein [Steroidobacteraceae bacterium]